MPFWEFFLIGLEGKVRRSDPAKQNKKVKAEEGASQAFLMLVTMCPSIDHLAERHPPSTRLWQPLCRWSWKGPTLQHCHHRNCQRALWFFWKLMPHVQEGYIFKGIRLCKNTHVHGANEGFFLKKHRTTLVATATCCKCCFCFVKVWWKRPGQIVCWYLHKSLDGCLCSVLPLCLTGLF